jgi:hypothetical protein
MNKKTIIYIIAAFFLIITIIIGILGYIEAREIKTQAEQIKEITAETLNLKPVRDDEFELPIKDWGSVAQKTESIKTDLNKFDRMPKLLKEDIEKFYSEQTAKRMEEARFLQSLIDNQRKIGLQDKISEKSKGQIETVLNDIEKFKNEFNQEKSFFAGSDFDSDIMKLQIEANNFENYLKMLYGRMTYESGKVSVETTSLNNIFEELKIKLIESLNGWVSFQEKIKGEISNMGANIWINPFISSNQ